MDYANADGEPVEMCGNGIRCLAKYVYDRGLTTAREIDVLTGEYTNKIVDSNINAFSYRRNYAAIYFTWQY